MNDFDTMWAELGESRVMVLSTCAEDRVTSRSMSMVIYGGKFYCQTNEDYLKCRQIKVNPNVSLCSGNFTAEGICRIIGKPHDNMDFISAMRKAYPDAVERWSQLPEECVLEITPAVVHSWVYENDVPYIKTWDFSDNTYRKERQ